jgi:hypothetical protein
MRPKKEWFYKDSEILPALGDHYEDEYPTYEDGKLFRLMVKRSTRTAWHAFSDGYAEVACRESVFDGGWPNTLVSSTVHNTGGKFAHIVDVNFQKMRAPAGVKGEMMGAGFLFSKQLCGNTLPTWPLDLAIVRKDSAQIAFNQFLMTRLPTPGLPGVSGSVRFIFKGRPPDLLDSVPTLRPLLDPWDALKQTADACHCCGEPAYMRDPYGKPVHATCEAEWRAREMSK